jgi:hypothetical protein
MQMRSPLYCSQEHGEKLKMAGLLHHVDPFLPLSTMPCTSRESSCFGDLADVSIIHALSYLEFVDLFSCALTDKHCLKATESDLIWRPQVDSKLKNDTVYVVKSFEAMN